MTSADGDLHTGDAGATDPTTRRADTAAAGDSEQARKAKRARQRRDQRKRKRSREPGAGDGGKSRAGDAGDVFGDVDDPVANAVRSELERPLDGPDDLAALLCRVQMMMVGAAQDSPYEAAARALRWTEDGEKPSRQCSIGARMIWPWLEKSGAQVHLLEQSEGVLACIGLVVLLAPAVGPTVSATRKILAARKAKAADADQAKNRIVDLHPAVSA